MTMRTRSFFIHRPTNVQLSDRCGKAGGKFWTTLLMEARRVSRMLDDWETLLILIRISNADSCALETSSYWTLSSRGFIHRGSTTVFQLHWVLFVSFSLLWSCCSSSFSSSAGPDKRLVLIHCDNSPLDIVGQMDWSTLERKTNRFFIRADERVKRQCRYILLELRVWRWRPSQISICLLQWNDLFAFVRNGSILLFSLLLECSFE